MWMAGPRGPGAPAGRHTRPVQLSDLVSDWYRANARDLLWRRPGTTPWGVLVSEFMLQQTPVARVEPIWREWMERWPRPSNLAAAPRADVLRAWASSAIRGAPCGCTRRRGSSRSSTATSSRRAGGVGGAARCRLLHGTGRRGVRPRPALPRRRHERPPGGRAGRARYGRRRTGAGSRRPRRRRRPAPARRRRRRARVRRVDGAGRGGVHGPNAPVHGVPGPVGVRVAARGPPGLHRPATCRASLRGDATGRSAAA